MNKKTKTQEDSKLREPRAKTNRFGLKVPTIRMPHEDLIKPEQLKSEIVPLMETTDSSMPSQTSLTRHTAPNSQSEIAPTRNFQKVPNSITKAAIPEGLFKQGKSKHLYDVLYSLTRGAVEPKRTVRISKTKLRKLAAIGSRVTFDSCVSHLEIVGLLKLTVRVGEHEGNEFEVLLPEEASLPSQTSVTSLTRHAQKLDTLVNLETSQTRQTSKPVNTGVSGIPNTSFKTNKNDDDDAFADFVTEFEKFSRKVTGRGIRSSEKAKWRELAQVIILELEIAAARTNVSSLPAFGAEHLRRRLFGKARPEKKSQNDSSRVGETPPQIWESFDEKGNLIAKPLTEEGKAENLKILREMIAEGFSTSGMEKFFTPEDWAELNQTLNKS